MTDKQIYIYFGEAANYCDPNTFASDVATAIIDPEDPDQEVNIELIGQLCILWHIAMDPFKEFLKLIKLNQTQCSIRFCIPLRTIQNWAEKKRETPNYIRLMMAETLGIIKIRQQCNTIPRRRSKPG